MISLKQTALWLLFASLLSITGWAHSYDAPPKDQGHTGSLGGGAQGGPPNNAKPGEAVDPIHIKTGNYSATFDDLVVNSFSQPLVSTRTYNSQAVEFDGPLGRGWSLAYFMQIARSVSYVEVDGVVVERETVVLRDDSGYLHQYQAEYNEAGNTVVGWQNPRGRFGVLFRSAPQAYTWTRNDGTRLEFEQNRLASIVDLNGNQTSLTYDSQGRLTRVTSPSGRFLTYAYNPANKIQTISDNSGRSVSFGYDSNNLLTSVTNTVGATTTMSYGADFRLAALVSPLGDEVLSNVYDETGRVTLQTVYGGQHRLAYFDGYTSVLNPLNRTTLHYFNSYGNVVRERDEAGANSYFTWDEAGNVVEYRDQRNNVTDFSYNDLGNVTQIDYEDGSSQQITYGSHSRVTSIVDGAGEISVFEYDANGNLLTATDPLGQIERYEYDNAGRLTSYEDKAGKQILFEYSTSGDLIRRTDRLGNSIQWSYDNVGRVVSETDEVGNSWQVGYDARDRIVSIENPLGNSYEYTYDLNNNLLGITSPLGTTVAFAYSPYNYLLSRSDELGNTYSYTYDLLGNRTSVVDPEGRQTTISYDVRNLVTLVTRGDGSRVRYFYDSAKNLTDVYDNNNRRTRYFYDDLNRPIQTRFADNSTTQVQYNNVGLVTSIVDRKGQTFTYTYDELYRLVGVQLPNDGVFAYSYNSLDDLTQASGYGATLFYSYDDEQRLTRAVGAWGNEVLYTYDAAHRLTSVSRPDRFEFNYTYDTNDRLIEAQLPSGIVEYTYDADDRLTSVDLPNGISTLYTYDPADRPLSVRHVAADGTTTLVSNTYEYLASSLTSAMIDQDGIRTTYAYDGFYRLTNETTEDSSGGQLSATSYTYDGNGNRLTRTIDGTTVNYTYDSVNQLLTEGANSFTYDANGNLVSETSGAGTRTYTYNDLDWLVSIDGDIAQQHAFQYDVWGQRTQRTVGLETSRYVYDFGSILEETDATNAALVQYEYALGLVSQSNMAQRHFFHNDVLGHVRGLFDLSGAVVGTYKFDAFGDQRVFTGSISNRFNFNGGFGAFDEPDAGLVQTGSRYYKPQLGRFISVDPSRQGNNHYTYALNNPVNFSDPSGEVLIWGCIGNGLLDAGFGELGSRAGNASKQRGWWDRAVDFGIGCATGAIGIGFVSKLDKGNDARKLVEGLGRGRKGKPPSDGSAPKSNLTGKPDVENVTKRPGSFRKQTVKDSWDNAADGSKPGTKQCPTCKKDVSGNPHKGEKRNGPDGWDNDHQPKWKDRDLTGMSRKQVLDEFNKDTRLRCPNCNRADN